MLALAHEMQVYLTRSSLDYFSENLPDSTYVDIKHAERFHEQLATAANTIDSKYFGTYVYNSIY